MPQTKYDLPIADQAAADEIIKKTEDIKGVKFVNINPNGTQGNRTIKTYQTTTVREKTYFAKLAFYNV